MLVPHHNKRYKNAPNKPKISYLICGEYGDKFKRPHYHAIVFGAHADDIVKSWPYGAIYFGANNPDATVKYALKYVMKSRLWKSMGGSYERPFINVSKGIGASLIERGSKTYQVVNTETGEFHKYKITCYNSNVPEQIEFGGIRMLLTRYYTKNSALLLIPRNSVLLLLTRLVNLPKDLANRVLLLNNGRKTITIGSTDLTRNTIMIIGYSVMLIPP